MHVRRHHTPSHEGVVQSVVVQQALFHDRGILRSRQQLATVTFIQLALLPDEAFPRCRERGLFLR